MPQLGLTDNQADAISCLQPYRTHMSAMSVRWKDRPGVFQRDVGGGGHSEVHIAERVYRAKSAN